MFVSEKDLFKFVFYPEVLSSDIFDYISKNQNDFKEELRVFKAMKNTIVADPKMDDILQKINYKIEEYESDKEVILEKVDERNATDLNYFTVDAESDIYGETSIIETFSDKKSKYIAKVLSSSIQTSIQLLSKDTIELKDIQIIIHPTEDKFIIKSSLEPLVIKSARKIESITLYLHED